MKLRRTIIKLLVLFAMVCATKMAHAGIYCERKVSTDYQVGTAGVSKTTHQRVYLNQDMLKIEEVESGELTIVRLDNKQIFKLNPSDKTYTQTALHFPKQQLIQEGIDTRQRLHQAKQGQAAVRKKSAETVPKELRPVMEQMMKMRMRKMRESMVSNPGIPGDTSPAEIKLTPDTKTILGHPTNRLKVVQTIAGEKKKIVEAWVAPEIEPQNYLSGFAVALGLFNSDVTEELKKVNGFPLNMKYRIQSGHLNGNLQTVTVTKLEEKNLPIQEFEIPAGYKPVAVSSYNSSN